MRRTLALIALTTALLLAVGSGTALAGQYDYLLAPLSACPRQYDTTASVDTQEQVMHCMHDYARSKQSLPPLSTRPVLQSSSGYKAADIMRCQDFSHYACGRDVFYWPRKLGYMNGCYGVGENIAWGSGSLGSVHEIMRGWLYSDPHRHNILNGRFRDKGVGLVRGTFKGYSNAAVWVTHFGYHC